MGVKRRLKAVAVMILCTLLCVLGSTAVCSAAQQRYTITEIDDMIVFLPDNMMAVTRSASQADRYFSVFGLDYQTTMNNFKNGDIYLQGMDSMSGVTITVTMTKTLESKGIGNYKNLKTEELSEVTNNFLGQSEYTACTPDNANNVVWLNFETNVSNNGKTIKAYQANTIYDGMSVNITLQRNNGDVTAEDYETFHSVVTSANFLRAESMLNSNFMQYIFIGAGALVIIIIVVLIIVIIKQAKRRRKKNHNDKIIEELAGKYAKRKNNYVEAEEYQDIEPENTESNYVEESEDDFFSGVESQRIEAPAPIDRVSDSEIDEILGFAEKSEDEMISDVTEKEVVAKPEKVQVEVIKSEAVEVEETTEDEQYDFDEFDEEAEALEEYNNDEELVRQESKHTKFIDSDDFFEEAPKKTMGVISSKDIRDAEDYDVINEVEKRVSEVEKSNSTVGENVLNTLKKIGGGFKSFGIHFGYFCTNVSRMIKRKNAQRKRQKAEQERRERARMRAEKAKQQRRQMQDGGLVQVHRRSHNASQNRRPGSPQRRPSQNGNRRPPQSGTRRPNGTNRRR